MAGVVARLGDVERRGVLPGQLEQALVEGALEQLVGKVLHEVRRCLLRAGRGAPLTAVSTEAEAARASHVLANISRHRRRKRNDKSLCVLSNEKHVQHWRRKGKHPTGSPGGST